MVDVDEVPEAIEAGHPWGGDGNWDGTPDARQAHVLSMPTVVLGCFDSGGAGRAACARCARGDGRVRSPGGGSLAVVEGGVLLYLRLPGKGSVVATRCDLFPGSGVKGDGLLRLSWNLDEAVLYAVMGGA